MLCFLRLRPCVLGWLSALSICVGLARPTAAEEPSGLQVAAALENVLTDVIARNEKSLVAIARIKRGQHAEIAFERPSFLGNPVGIAPGPGQTGFIPNDYGTGVVIDRAGLILTHYQVLGEDLGKESDFYVTTVDRKTYHVTKIKAADPRSDLAVLEIDARDLEPIKFGDAATLKKGQIVIAMGNPYAIASDGQVSASWGIVSNLSRKAGPNPDESDPAGPRGTLHHYGTLIQTDAKLNLGTSGGALINLKGEMVGLTTSLAAAAGYEQAAGYALPVDQTFRRAVEALRQGREVDYGVLGVRPAQAQRSPNVGGKQGVMVDWVVPGAPADRYGVRVNDLITHVNGEPIYDADGLVLQVGKLPADGTVRLTIERDGRVIPIQAELTKYPVRGNKIVTTPAPSWRGIRVDYASTNPEFFNNFASERVEFSGVLVSEVEEQSPAWKEGLRPNMFITHVGNTPVSTPKEFHATVTGKNGPVPLRLSLPASDRPVRTIPPGDG